MDKRIIIAIAALLVMSVVPGVAAQSSTLSGQILDQNGTPVEGVEVRLYQWGYSEPETKTCDANGECTADSQPYPSNDAVVLSDAEGRYSFAVRSGWANLNFFKDGYTGHYEGLEINGDHVLDVELLKYPAKSAQITGRVTGAGAALPYVSISAENPVYGTYECSVIEGEEQEYPVAIDSEPARPEAESSEGADEDQARSIAPGEPYPGYQGCAIIIQKDGSFSGMVTPGYTILRFYHQDWRNEGGQQYYSKSLVRDLPANATTKLDIDLKARAGPDSIVQGYIIDAATKAPVTGVYVSFSNMDSYGWANAKVDSEGSYKVALRNGVIQVSVYADGYLPWEGDVTAVAGETVRFDVHLTAGQSRYGGCCIAYAEGDRAAPAMAAGAEAAPTSPQAGAPARDVSTEEDASKSQFSDLGGGLGPYDASTAPQSGDADTGAPDVQTTPGFEIVALALGLLAVVLLRRK